MIGLSTLAKEIEEGVTFQLIEEFDGNASGLYGFIGSFSFTVTQSSGEMTITELDMSEQIVSGTFF